MSGPIPTMIDVSDAYRILFDHITTLPAVELPLGEALYRTLASSICCDTDHPPFDRSVMDGYAVRAADVEKTPATLKVAGQLAAGATTDHTLSSGEALQINTGAVIPSGADAVVRVEDTQADESSGLVIIQKSVKEGNFITPRATYSRAGDELLHAGTLLTPAQIGVVASAGLPMVSVYRQPVVAVVSTGDELVDIDQQPKAAQIRNSNQYQLESLIRSAHAQPAVVGIARDDRSELKKKILEGLQYDVLCITGGVSMGVFDYVPEVLESCGATFHFKKLAIKPGRPVHFATTCDGTLIFALPGNPVSAWICFELLVRPAIYALQGRSGCVPCVFHATLDGQISATRDRQTYIPALASVNERGQWTVKPVSWHGSGDALGLGHANAMIVRDAYAEAAQPEATVSIMLFD